MKTFLKISLLAILLAASYAAYDAYTFLTTPANKRGQEIIFSIEKGATFDRVAWDLKKAGAISDVDRFRVLGRYKKAITSVRAGDYSINTGWTPPQVLFHLTKGAALLFRLSVREGLPWWETAEEVERQGFARYEDFVEVIHDKDFLNAHAIPFENAEGFLLPETYFLSKPKKLDRQQAEYIASLMVKTFWQKTIPLWKELAIQENEKANYGSAVSYIGKENSPLDPEEFADFAWLSVFGTTAPEKTSDPSAAFNASNKDNSSSKETGENYELEENLQRNNTDKGSRKRSDSSATPEIYKKENKFIAAIRFSNSTNKEEEKERKKEETEKNGTSAQIPDKLPLGNSASAPQPADETKSVDHLEKNELGNSSLSTAIKTEPAPIKAEPDKTPKSNASLTLRAMPLAVHDTASSNSSIIKMKANKKEKAPIKTMETTEAIKDLEATEEIWPYLVELKENFPQHPGQIKVSELRKTIIIASLVEKESAVPKERPKISGVYHNRLQKGMLLQCDPTIIYGIGPSFTGSILRSQLQDGKNLYNTYIHPGLPPGPISSFGVDAMLAALFPQKHKYLYFVATGLGKDHTFSKTLTEHNAAVRIYRSRTR